MNTGGDFVEINGDRMCRRHLPYNHPSSHRVRTDFHPYETELVLSNPARYPEPATHWECVLLRPRLLEVPMPVGPAYCPSVGPSAGVEAYTDAMVNLERLFSFFLE